MSEDKFLTLQKILVTGFGYILISCLFHRTNVDPLLSDYNVYMQQTLFYLGNVAVIGYLAFIIGKQLYESNKLKNWQQETQAEFEAAKYEMDVVRRDHLALINQVYSHQFGKDILSQLEKHIYFEGMPMILLLTSLGLPDKIQDGFHKGVSVSKWYYGETFNRLGNSTFDLEITVENYKVAGWRDLK